MLADEDPERRRRLEEAHDLYAFLERELPRLLQQWERERALRQSSERRARGPDVGAPARRLPAGVEAAMLRNLWRRPVRTALTMLGIAIGVAAVVSLGAMAEGFMRNYNTAVGLNSDILVSQANAYDVLFSVVDESLQGAHPGRAGRRDRGAGRLHLDCHGGMPFFLIFGYEPGSAALRHYRIVEGKPVTAPKQIALGRRAADSLKKRVGDNLRLYGDALPDRGHLRDRAGHGGIGRHGHAERRAEHHQRTPARSACSRWACAGAATPTRCCERIENIDKTLTATVASEYQGNESYAAMMQGMAWGIAAIAVLVGGLGMMNAMVMSVLERTREIGTLRALGWSRRRVLLMILREALVLSVLGGIAGRRAGHRADRAGRAACPASARSWPAPTPPACCWRGCSPPSASA